jgi:hypothetical protein
LTREAIAEVVYPDPSSVVYPDPEIEAEAARREPDAVEAARQQQERDAVEAWRRQQEKARADAQEKARVDALAIEALHSPNGSLPDPRILLSRRALSPQQIGNRGRVPLATVGGQDLARQARPPRSLTAPRHSCSPQ